MKAPQLDNNMIPEPQKPNPKSANAFGIALVVLLIGFVVGFACHGEYQRLSIGPVIGLGSSDRGQAEHIGLTTVRTFYFTCATNGFWDMESKTSQEKRSGKVTFRGGNTAQIRLVAGEKKYEGDYLKDFKATFRVSEKPLNSIVIDRDFLAENGKSGRFCARIESRGNVGFIEVSNFEGMGSEDAIEFMIP